MPQNLEQIRASHADAKAAFCRKRPDEGDCLSGYPSLIINNGLLAALAFSIEKGKQHQRVADAVGYHLHHLRTVWQTGPDAPNAKTLRDALMGCDSFKLRHATDEAIAFLSYLKRFAKSSD